MTDWKAPAPDARDPAGPGRKPNCTPTSRTHCGPGRGVITPVPRPARPTRQTRRPEPDSPPRVHVQPTRTCTRSDVSGGPPRGSRVWEISVTAPAYGARKDASGTSETPRPQPVRTERGGQWGDAGTAAGRRPVSLFSVRTGGSLTSACLRTPWPGGKPRGRPGAAPVRRLTCGSRKRQERSPDASHRSCSRLAPSHHPATSTRRSDLPAPTHDAPAAPFRPIRPREREHDQAPSERYRPVSPTRDDHEPQP